MKKVLIGLVVAVALTASCRGKTDDGKLTIAVIPKGTTHAFWQSIHAGAEKGAQEVGATVIWRGPLRERRCDPETKASPGGVSDRARR